MARELPRYLWDVLADVVEYEDQHGDGHPCLAKTLDRLPPDVRTGAEVIVRYRAAGRPTTEAHEAPSAPDATRTEMPRWGAAP